LSAWEIEQLADQVWNEMVNEIVFRKVYQRHQIEVTDAEVIEYIKANPLPELMRAPELQTDGRFDYDKYLAILANPQAGSLVLELERDARDKIPSFKLFLEIASLSKLTEAQIERAYKEREEKVQVNYIRLNTDSLVSDQEVAVSEEEIKQYYEANRKKFDRPEMAALDYLFIPVTPGSDDTLAAQDTLSRVLELLDKGENWDSLALKYSRDQLARSGGDLGWFARGDYNDNRMVDLAFSLKPGQVSKPTVTDDGCQIVRLDSARTRNGKREVKAHRILYTIQAGSKKISELRTRARGLRRAMHDSEQGFHQVAVDSGFTALSTGLFAIGSPVPGIQVSRELLDFVYSAKQGSLSYPLNVYLRDSEGGEVVLIALVVQRKDAGITPLAEAADSIRYRLMLDKKKIKCTELIQTLTADYDQYENLEAFAKAKGMSLVASPEFTRLTGLEGVGRNNAFIGTAFGLPVGRKSGIIETGDNFYLLEVVSRTEADNSRLQQSRDRLVQQLTSQRMQMLFSLFTNELLDKTAIEDLRKIQHPDSLARAMN
ncbi:MAG: hypothetical protein A2Z86_11570, partial [Candidatus Glassbacteria bacterium GWA2_58_10]